jgi:uncharacterized protein YecE (DUF72 family)
MSTIRIGVSGWRYAPWRGVFYPAGLPQREELRYASKLFNSIEINGSFYSLQRPEYYRQWYDDTPEDFVFAVKGPRFITHMKRLREIETPLANFFASGVFNLREKFGPVLWQFPPRFRYDAVRFEQFLRLLPYDTAAALKLARRRDFRVKGRSRLAIDAVRPLRHAVEIRDKSFLNTDFAKQLRRHNVALVIAETAGRWPLLFDITADFIYLRLHGDKKLYRSGYSEAALRRWAQCIATWRRGGEVPGGERIGARSRSGHSRDVFCFFDNTDEKLRAPVDARSLMRKLGLASAA